MEIVEKQPRIFRQLQKSIEHGHLAHAYLFEGARGTGKKEMALWVAKALFCQNHQGGNPCGTCNNCVRIQAEEHPDVVHIQPDGQKIKVDQIREIKDSFSKSGMETNQKVMIVEDIDKMTVNAANSLLKFIEEPDGQIVVFLLTENRAQVLPTIQSRCQILTFQTASKIGIQKQLETQGITPKVAATLSHLTNSYQQAVDIYENEWFNEAREAVNQWFGYLIKKDKLAFIFVQKTLVKAFKEKEQQQLLFDLLLLKYRDMLIAEVQVENVLKAKEAENPHYTGLQIVEIMEEILLSRQKLTSNVNFQNVCEQFSWRMLASA